MKKIRIRINNRSISMKFEKNILLTYGDDGLIYNQYDQPGMRFDSIELAIAFYKSILDFLFLDYFIEVWEEEKIMKNEYINLYKETLEALEKFDKRLFMIYWIGIIDPFTTGMEPIYFDRHIFRAMAETVFYKRSKENETISIEPSLVVVGANWSLVREQDKWVYKNSVPKKPKISLANYFMLNDENCFNSTPNS